MVRFVADDEDGPSAPAEGLAPVIPLFGSDAPRDRAVTPATRDEPVRAEEAANRAEAALLRRLATRQLSVREARTMLRDGGSDDALIDDVIDACVRRGYLDDARLAEQLVHAGVERKGQGRHVIAQTLAKRGVPREIADAALAQLPDDDAERALEFARTKARSLSAVDRDAALRRLMGQLARRGYPGSVAMSAARAALDELGSASRVRFR